MKKIYIYSKYERFWHWTQAGLIFLLALTGFEVHGTYEMFSYEKATLIHNNAAWALIVLSIFTWFWSLVTGQWKQFNPMVISIKHIRKQISFYTKGIFHQDEHPTLKTKYTKFNPLQRLTYLGLVVVLIPLMVVTGILYMYYFHFLNEEFIHIGQLNAIALLHTLGAFLLFAFVIAHVYLTTTGYKPLSSIKAMVLGWEEMSDKEAEHAIKIGLQMKMEEQEKEIKNLAENKHLLNNALQSIVDKQEVSQKEAILKAIKNTSIGYFRLDINGFYTDVNEGWLNMYKCTNIKEVIGQHVTLNRPEEEKEKVKDIVKQVLAGEIITNREVIRVCKDGTIGYHNIAASPVYDKNRKITGIEGFIIDTTKLKEGKN